MSAASVDVSASLHDSHTITWHWPGKTGLKLCAPQSFQLFQIRDNHGHSLLISDPELSDAGCCYTLNSPNEAGQASIYLNLNNLGVIDWQHSALSKGEQWLPLAGIVPQSVMMEDTLVKLASSSPGLWLKPQQESKALLYLDSALRHETTTGPSSGIIQYGGGQSKSSQSTPPPDSNSDSGSHTGTSESRESGATRGAVGGMGGGAGGNRDGDNNGDKRPPSGHWEEKPDDLADIIIRLTPEQRQAFKDYCKHQYNIDFKDEHFSDNMALREYISTFDYEARSHCRALVNTIKLGDSEPTSLTPNQLRIIRTLEWLGSFVPYMKSGNPK